MKNLILRLIVIVSMINPLTFLYAQPPLKPLKKMVEHKESTESHKEHENTKPSKEHHDGEEKEHSHKVSIDELLKGNENFRNDVRKNQNFDMQRQELSKGQKPNFIVVACSDSRVAPELIFDSGLGEIFVVRTAGNVVDSVCLGSIEYAAEHLHSTYILVLGHTSCGAVTAAMQGETESAYINSIIKYIAPAANKAKSTKTSKEKMLMTAIQENVLNQIKYIRKSPIIQELEHENQLNIIPAIYDIKDGTVEIIK